MEGVRDVALFKPDPPLRLVRPQRGHVTCSIPYTPANVVSAVSGAQEPVQHSSWRRKPRGGKLTDKERVDVLSIMLEANCELNL